MTMQQTDELIAQLDYTKPIYIFSPDEPELQILVQGEFLRFTNGRLIVNPSPASEQIIQEFRKSKRNFLMSDNLADPMLVTELFQRVTDMCVRRAHASNPQRVIQDARFMLAAMLSTSQDSLPRMGTEELARAISAAMPRTAAELLVPDDYSAQAKQQQDADMIERSLKENPQEDLTNANTAEPQNQPVAPSAPQAPEPPQAPQTPAVDPDSPFATVMTEPEEPAPEQPAEENPFA